MTMTTTEIAAKYFELCSQGKNSEAAVLYSPDAVSVEAWTPPVMDREAVGMKAIAAKGEWWLANNEVHSSTMTGPWPHGDRFKIGRAHV